MNQSVKGKAPQPARLWEVFFQNLLEHGVASEQAGWYVMWAEGFAKSMKGTLASRSSGDVLRHPEKLAGRAGRRSRPCGSSTRNSSMQAGRGNGNGTKRKAWPSAGETTRRAGRGGGPGLSRFSGPGAAGLGGYDIRTVQKLLGHENVATTMIYTQVMNRPGLVKSPVDLSTQGLQPRSHQVIFRHVLSRSAG
jgi:hypothetical protein